VTVDALNARFLDGHPSSNLAEAGVLVHTFDRTEGQGLEHAPWMPCGETEWCAQFSDRISASIVNSNIRLAFHLETGGIVLSPSSTTILCSYFADGGTMTKMCTHPAPRDCVPGCSDQYTMRPVWCNPEDLETGGDIYSCAWKPEHLQYMIGHHMLSVYYNEVVVGTRDWATRLPSLIDAFFFSRQDHSVEERMRGIHSDFMSQYPEAKALLVSFDIDDLEEPFRLA